jgi:osmotically-inducible protein OsmY
MWCLSLFLLLILSLQACVNVATTGAQALYNNHSLKKSWDDQYITMQVYEALHVKAYQFDDANISVSTFNGEVLLAGQVPTRIQKIKIEHMVKAIPGVKGIYNTLAIAAPSSTLIRASDTWITAKVKAKLIASADVDATQIKVVTENGTVYLMGTLVPEEAAVAFNIAHDTDGVQKVVRLFSYIKITKSLV